MTAKVKRPKKTGRPSLYREEYARLAERFCLLGATDAELAKAFEVSEALLNEWKNKHPSFLEALKSGRDQADSRVAERLYQRAMGYSHEAVKIFADPKTGTKLEVPFVEHFPPDTTACIFWLKNRQRAKWRDVQDHQVTQTITGLPEEVMTRARKLMNGKA